PCALPILPSHVKALLFSLVYTAPDNIFYFFRVELRVALEQCVDQRSRQRLRTHVAETTVFGTTHRSPHAIDDDNVSRIKAHRSFSVRKSRSGLAKEFRSEERRVGKECRARWCP